VTRRRLAGLMRRACRDIDAWERRALRICVTDGERYVVAAQAAMLHAEIERILDRLDQTADDRVEAVFRRLFAAEEET